MCICFHLLLVVISPLLFRQLCSLSSSPVFFFFFFFFLCQDASFLTAIPCTGLGPQQWWQLPSLGVACSLELSLRQLDGKILYPPVELDPCKTSHAPRDTSAGSVGLRCLLTFQHSYPLKPPGASLVTLPHHPFPLGGHGEWHTTAPCSILPLPTFPSSIWGQLTHSTLPPSGPRVR